MTAIVRVVALLAWALLVAHPGQACADALTAEDRIEGRWQVVAYHALEAPAP
jgi:hypothetical protein